MSKILVTGGLGYIGSHTVVELHNQGYEVVIIDDLSNTSLNVLESIHKITNSSIKFVELDLKNSVKTKEFVSSNKEIDGVIHFAASKAVGESVENPLKYYTNNLFSLTNLLNELKNLNKEINFIFSSSATVYGDPKILPITESEPIKKAESPYGNTKQIGEEIIKDLVNSSSNFNAISLRYFNPIGSHESAIIGDNPEGIPNNLMPYILKVHNSEIDHLKIFGSDYNTHDGTGIRDYIHIEDLAKGHLDALECLVNQDRFTDFINLGTGIGSSVMEVVNAFETVSNKKIPYEIYPKREGDAESCYADVKKAEKILNWKSKYDLVSMCNSVYKYSKNTK